MMAGPACSAELLSTLKLTLQVDDAAAKTLCAALSAQFSNQPSLNEIRMGLDTAFLLYAGSLAFVMHAGFAMLCAGALRSKNTVNILLQTVLDACVSALAFYVLGFGFAYGESDHPNRFIGNALFGLHSYKTSFTGNLVGSWTDWFFAWAFAATASTIPAGCVAERFNFDAYLGYSLLLSSFVYPVVVHWVWSRHGWLAFNSSNNALIRDDFLFGSGMIDFAGSGVVHLTGALTGFWGCYLVGPRLGRFDINGTPVDLPGHNIVLSVLGTVLLWFGWYGFNPGSIATIDTTGAYTVAGRAAVTTTLSGAAGGVSLLIISFIFAKAWDLMALCNGVLVGFVSVTACAHVVEPWAAVIVGALGAVVFELGCRWLLRLQIDDPLSAFPMHGLGGILSVLYTGLLAKEEYVAEAYGKAKNYGLFYGGGGRLLACQVIGILAIVAWVSALMGLLFWVLKQFKVLRVSAEHEHAGIDASKHGGSAYRDHGMVAGMMSVRGGNAYHPGLAHNAISYLPGAKEPPRDHAVWNRSNHSRGSAKSLTWNNTAGGGAGYSVQHSPSRVLPVEAGEESSTVGSTPPSAPARLFMSQDEQTLAAAVCPPVSASPTPPPETVTEVEPMIVPGTTGAEAAADKPAP